MEKRGVKENREFSILTAEISKATFGMTPSEYKSFKELDRPSDNLRDHMTDLELIFTMLGEASTTEIARKKIRKAFLKIKKRLKKVGQLPGMQERHWKKRAGKKFLQKKIIKFFLRKK